MKKLIKILSALISVIALIISVFTLKRLKSTEKNITESYKELTENALKTAEKLCSINLDLLNTYSYFCQTCTPFWRYFFALFILRVYAHTLKKAARIYRTAKKIQNISK